MVQSTASSYLREFYSATRQAQPVRLSAWSRGLLPCGPPASRSGAAAARRRRRSLRTHDAAPGRRSRPLLARRPSLENRSEMANEEKDEDSVRATPFFARTADSAVDA